jgi:hypothetical protein
MTNVVGESSGNRFCNRHWGPGTRPTQLSIDGARWIWEHGDIVKHISIFMRSTFDLPDSLVKRAKIAAVKRGATLRDLVAEGLRRVLSDEQYAQAQRKRMTEAPVKLSPGHSIPVLSNREITTLFDHEELANLNDVYRGR